LRWARNCGTTVLVSLPAAAVALENRAIGRSGEPTLAGAYDILLREWRSGAREREPGLHVAFLAWYMLVEPPDLTYRKLEPEGIRPETFAARGFYGDYFAGQARVKGGY
jgi:hypothetical protein